MENKYHYVIKLLIESDRRTYDLNVMFSEGDEEELSHFLVGLKEYYNNKHQTEEDLKIQKRVTELLDNSFHYFKWEKVFENLDLTSLNKNGIKIFEKILKSTCYDVFLEKMHKCNDPVIACYYFSKYADVNELSKEAVMQQFINYFEDYKSRIGLSYEKILKKIMETYHNSHNCGGVELDECLVYVYSYLLGKIEYDLESQTVLLRFILAYFDGKYRNALIRRFLEISNSIYFDVSFDRVDEYSRGTNIVELNILTRDFETAIEAFNDNRFLLYENEKLSKLTSDFCYSQENDNFIDRLNSTLRMIREVLRNNMYGGYKEEYLLQIIYSDKIKVLSVNSISIIRELLSEKEFNKFMLHVIDDDITVYCGKMLLLTRDFVNTKMARRISNDSQRALYEMESLLERDQYVNNYKK